MAISPESKMKSKDRILVLSVMDDKKPKNTIGNTDPRLFTGENKLHAIMDDATTMWRFKYEMGGVPEPLKCSFTSFSKLYDHARQYFLNRNIEIKEVKD